MLSAILLASPSLWAASDPAAPPVSNLEAAPPAPHANPRLKGSYRLFSISNLDGTPLWLNGAQLDVYLLSRRWVRLGLELEGGAGHATLSGNGLGLSYGLAGLTAALQYPARVTPFLEGRFAAGVLSGQLDGTITVGSASLTQASATTYLYGGGLETGLEVYVWKRAYLSAGVGWVRTTWHGVDYQAMLQNPTGGLRYKDLSGDSVTLKLGFGI